MVAVGAERRGSRASPGPPPLGLSPPARTMADDDVLFEDVYELCEVIGK